MLTFTVNSTHPAAQTINGGSATDFSDNYRAATNTIFIISWYFIKVNSKEVTFFEKIVYTKGISIELGAIIITTGDAVRKRILELCQSNNITINKLATISGVTQSTVNNIVSKRNNSATVATIKKLCDGIGITISEFFDTEYFNNLEQEIK